MKILSVKINNILSIENAEVAFDDTGLMLVKGWNHDTSRANGAGKTALFNAISFALYDKLPRKVTASEILRRGSKAGSVTVTVEIGVDQYVVRRSRPKGVTFTDKAGTALTISQEEWEAKLKLNYNQFMMIAYCAQNVGGGASTRFLSVNDADKKKFLLQLLDLDGFTSAKKHADDKAKALLIEQDGYRNKMTAIDSKVDAYQESLVDETVINHAVTAANATIASLTKQLLLEQTVQKPDLSKYQQLETDLAVKEREVATAKAQRSMLHEQYRKLKARQHPFSGADSCKACGSVLDTTAAKAAHQKELAERDVELGVIKRQIDGCDNVVLRESKLAELSAKIREKKKEESRVYDTAILNAMDLRNRIQSKSKEVENLNLKLQNNFELDSKIQVLLTSRGKLTDLVASTQSQIELYKTVSAMYSPTGAQAYILDSVVESFNDCVKEYVKLLWSTGSYELLSYKENDSGDVSAKFSETFTVDGNEISIGSLSGGEYRALSLCVDFALIDVIERQFGIRVSPIVLDEPFEHLDSEGRELIVDLLKTISDTRHIIVIDHASEVKSMFSKALLVEKRDGISSVSLEA